MLDALPASQLRHAVAPGLLWKVPMPQATHACAPVDACTVPAGHEKQADKPVVLENELKSHTAMHTHKKQNA